MFWFVIAKLYSLLYGFCHDHLGVNLRGIGFFMRRIKTAHVLTVEGVKMYLNPAVSSCYIRNINGKFNEPETHVFLNHLITSFREPLIVVDVGANVGEMVIDAARYSNVREVIGFEPNRDCVEACLHSVALNKFANVRIIEKALNEDGKPVSFNFSANAVLSSLLATVDRHGELIEATTLDLELGMYDCPAILLIDVEGAEKLVMLGGKKFIDRNVPVIIFEFNEQTRHFYTLQEITEILGKNYSVFRLRGDGLLDRGLDDTWNCVAVSSDSVFFEVCQSLIAG